MTHWLSAFSGVYNHKFRNAPAKAEVLGQAGPLNSYSSCSNSRSRSRFVLFPPYYIDIYLRIHRYTLHDGRNREAPNNM